MVYKVVKGVQYDKQRLVEGEKVRQLREWRPNAEGMEMAIFETDRGEMIPLCRDEVVQV